MGYDRGDSFPFDFKPNVIPFGSKSKGKMSPWSYPIQFERKWKHSFFSAEEVSIVSQMIFPLISVSDFPDFFYDFSTQNAPNI